MSKRNQRKAGQRESEREFKIFRDDLAAGTTVRVFVRTVGNAELNKMLRREEVECVMGKYVLSAPKREGQAQARCSSRVMSRKETEAVAERGRVRTFEEIVAESDVRLFYKRPEASARERASVKLAAFAPVCGLRKPEMPAGGGRSSEATLG